MADIAATGPASTKSRSRRVTEVRARCGTVVWTRGRWPPNLLPRICDWFTDRGFDRLWVSDPAEGWGAAAHRFTGTPDPLEEGARMFTFRGHHPRTGPPRHLSLSAERSVVPAAAPFPARGGGCSGPFPAPTVAVVSVA